MIKVEGQLPSLSKSQLLFYISCAVQQYGGICAVSGIASDAVSGAVSGAVSDAVSGAVSGVLFGVVSV
jgi:hypothetical protein